jgi:trk system potassium uptake protein TrkH
MSVLLMMVGGSSGSTAGGLKTVTVGVLLLALKSCLRGREEVTFRERTIPQRKVLAALTLVLVVGAVFIVSSMAIAIVDGVPYLAAAFEAASAIATVGLTTGITAGLSPLSHLMLILMMYLGRVGILSFSLAFLTQSGGANKIGYPETRVMIG